MAMAVGMAMTMAIVALSSSAMFITRLSFVASSTGMSIVRGSIGTTVRSCGASCTVMFIAQLSMDEGTPITMGGVMDMAVITAGGTTCRWAEPARKQGLSLSAS